MNFQAVRIPTTLLLPLLFGFVTYLAIFLYLHFAAYPPFPQLTFLCALQLTKNSLSLSSGCQVLLALLLSSQACCQFRHVYRQWQRMSSAMLCNSRRCFYNARCWFYKSRSETTAFDRGYFRGQLNTSNGG